MTMQNVTLIFPATYFGNDNVNFSNLKLPDIGFSAQHTKLQIYSKIKIY